MISGTMVYDPELRFTASGKPVLTFDLRVNPAIGDHVFRCVAWEALAEEIANDDKYFGNRDQTVTVDGYFKMRKYRDYESGEEKSVREYILRRIWRE